MRPLLAIAAVLGALLVAGSALAQDGGQWPPPEVTTQPHPSLPDPGHGPMPVPMNTGTPLATAPAPDPGASEASVGEEGRTAYDVAFVFGGLLAGLVTGIGGTLGACHLKREVDGSYTLTRGPMDWDAMKTQLDRIEAAILEGRSAANPPSSSPSGRTRNRRSPTLSPAGPEDPP